MKRVFVVIIFLLGGWNSVVNSQNIRIGLFYNRVLESFTFHCTSGSYLISSQTDSIMIVNSGQILYFERLDDKISINNGRSDPMFYQQLDLHEIEPGSTCRMRAIEPSSGAETYTGSFRVRLVHNAIQIINEFNFDKYLAGVVEAEGGPGATPEFYKAQAVICRTYALRNWNSHSSEGFNLCDETHCQVFRGLSDENPEIMNSVLSTHNTVLADKYSRLIVAAFHSNSGGETQRASFAWPVDYDYLQAIIDPFSKDQRNYKWHDNISVEIWIEYLKKKGFSVENLELSQTLVQQDHRRRHIILNEDTLPISTIRNDFGFKSAFFDMFAEGDNISITGRGYGHGIGLSQEGAMEMANNGYSFSDILRFYYHQVSIVDIKELPASELPVEFR